MDKEKLLQEVVGEINQEEMGKVKSRICALIQQIKSEQQMIKAARARMKKSQEELRAVEMPNEITAEMLA